MTVSEELQSGDISVLDESLAATLQHVGLMRDKREHLRTGQVAAEEQLLHRAAQLYRARKITEVELAYLYRSYSAVAVPGFTDRWKAIVPVSHGRMAHILRNIDVWDRNDPNMPDGTWRGPWPMGRSDHFPAYGVCVVYVLYDKSNEPCYTGSSLNLLSRLKDHAKDGKRFAVWTAFRCADREAAYQLEDKLLGEHLPYLNRKQGR